MTSKRGRQLKLDLFPKKDWWTTRGRPTKISISEEAPSYLMGSEDPEDVTGVYDSRYKELWVDPDQHEERTAGGGQRTVPGTLSHEIGHSRLRHTPSSLYPGQERESVAEFFQPLVDFTRALEKEGHRGLADHKWIKIRAFVQELETRILQETQGYKQDFGDTFADYFEEIYDLQTQEFYYNKNPIEKLIPIEAARQAVGNMVKAGHIDQRTAFKYLSKINKIVSKYR